MLPWEPGTVSQALAGTRWPTKGGNGREQRKGLFSKVWAELREPKYTRKIPTVSNNGKLQGTGLKGQGIGCVARMQANLQRWRGITQGSNDTRQKEVATLSGLPGRKGPRRINFSFIPLSHLKLVFPLASHRQKAEDREASGYSSQGTTFETQS